MNFKTHLCAWLITALCLLPIITPGADATIRSFLWEQANAQAMTASRSGEYLTAASTYNRLALDGVSNGLLFINLGNALVMGGDGRNAAAAFNRAERYIGATPETRQGLASALTLQTGHRQSDLPWSRAAFFWHYTFSCPMRTIAALVGWTVLWFGALLLILLRRSSSRHPLFRSLSETCLVSGGLLTIIFGASVLITLVQERHDRETWASRVFVSNVNNAEAETP